ncbi:MAG: acetylxylan esterase [Sphingomonas sp.]
MLRHFALLLWFAAATDSAPPQVVTIDRDSRGVTQEMRSLAVHVGGRVEMRAQNYRHQWPGVYFESTFKGDRVILRFDDAINEYRAQIDDMPVVTLDRPGRSDVTIAALGSGAHRIRLDKVTESDTPTTFGGFYVPAGNVLPSPPARRRQIEFIGDSSMTGYGARSDKRECSSEEVRRTTDTPRAFAALTARHYGADYQVNAISGRGLVRNYGGAVPDLAMARIYPRLFPSRPLPAYSDRGWRPQIVMIKLQADFIGFKPEVRWKDFDALVADYVESMGRFIADLHRRAPDAAILLWWFDTSRASAAERAMIDSAETRIGDAARKIGAPSITFLPFTGTGIGNSGCHFHFNIEEQRKVADWLQLQIDAHPEYWRGR